MTPQGRWGLFPLNAAQTLLDATLKRLAATMSERASVVTVATILLVFSLAATRACVSEYLIYRNALKTDVENLLIQKTLPFRGDTDQAILAAIQNIAARYGSRGCNGQPEGRSVACDQENSLLKAFSAAAHELPCMDGTSLEACVLTAATQAHVNLLPSIQKRVSLIDVQAVIRDSAVVRSNSIIPCPSSEPTTAAPHPNPHDVVFGVGGCDPPHTPVIAKLFVPPRSFGNYDVQVATRASIPTTTARLDASNQLSRTFDALLRLIVTYDKRELESCCDDRPGKVVMSPERPRSDGRQVVAAYFLSPDSLVRYWDKEGQSPVDVFRHSRLWGSSPFVELPLERQEHGFAAPLEEKQGAPIKPETAAERMCSSIPGEPYIDYGGYGIVQTRCSCALDSSGRLGGVVCTDTTMDLFNPVTGEAPPKQAPPPGKSEEESGAPTWPGWVFTSLAKFVMSSGQSVDEMTPPSGGARQANSLVSWRTVRVPEGVTEEQECEKRLKIGDQFSFPRSTDPSPEEADTFWSHARSELATGICKAVVSKGNSYYQDVQPIFASEEPSYFVATGRSDDTDGAYRLGLALHPNPIEPPARPAVICALGWSLFVGTLVTKEMFDRARASRLRQEAILQSLPAGVIDVSGEHTIEHGNDRAEELLGGPLRAFGGLLDSVEPRELRQFADPVYLKPTHPKRVHHMGVADEGKTTRCSIDVEQRPVKNGEIPSAERRAEEARSHEPCEDCQKQLMDCYQLADQSTIDRERRSGKVTHYYVRLRRAGEDKKRIWVRIKGSPLYEVSRMAQLEERTFAIVNTVPHLTHSQLDQRSKCKDFIDRMKELEKGRG